MWVCVCARIRVWHRHKCGPCDERHRRWLVWHPRVKFRAIDGAGSPWIPLCVIFAASSLNYLFCLPRFVPPAACSLVNPSNALWGMCLFTFFLHKAADKLLPHTRGFSDRGSVQATDPITAFPQHIAPFCRLDDCPGKCYKKVYGMSREEMVASNPPAQHFCSQLGTKMQGIFPRWLPLSEQSNLFHQPLFSLLFSSKPQFHLCLWLSFNYSSKMYLKVIESNFIF